jgi:hypothetical protein
MNWKTSIHSGDLKRRNLYRFSIHGNAHIYFRSFSLSRSLIHRSLYPLITPFLFNLSIIFFSIIHPVLCQINDEFPKWFHGSSAKWIFFIIIIISHRAEAGVVAAAAQKSSPTSFFMNKRQMVLRPISAPSIHAHPFTQHTII